MTAQGNNCSGIACDTFMQFQSRHRWGEVQDFFPDDYVAPTTPLVKANRHYLSRQALARFHRSKMTQRKEDLPATAA